MFGVLRFSGRCSEVHRGWRSLNVYRVMPVHPEDWLLLDMKWRGELLVDGALPFGLRSVPKLFTMLADALLWIMGQHGVVHAWHNLGNFLILGPPQSDLCRQHLETSLGLCKRLGIPIETHKLEGPAPGLSFLGIHIDSLSGTLSLPAEKLARLKGLSTAWRTRKCCKKRELLSLIGQLQHACRIVRAGRTFLRRMIDLSTVPRLGPTQSWLPVRSALVGRYLTAVEWGRYVQWCCTEASH